jgi:Holliday junction resolvasome RuvABC ATP-dependent DNA helicase subunit
MSFFRDLARASHKVSKYSGDAAALQSGGVPRLAKRVVRRVITRRAFGLFRNFR